MTGMVAGSLAFAVLYPFLESFYMSAGMGAITLPGLFRINHWIIMVILFACAGIMFYLMERYEAGKTG
jgi:hypothetical protein